MNVTPHVTQNLSRRRSAIDGRVTRHAGYVASQRIRKRIEEAFGWSKEIGAMRRTRIPRSSARRHGLRLHRRRLQPRPPAKTAGDMTKGTPTVVGKWRITGMSTWDSAYIDLVEPGFITFATREMGEMAFGAVTATLDCAFNAEKSDVSSVHRQRRGRRNLRRRPGRTRRAKQDQRRDPIPQRRWHGFPRPPMVTAPFSAAC